MGLFIPLDVEYFSDEEFIEAGPMAELLFIRANCFIKRKRLDGVIKKNQLVQFAHGIPQPKRAVRALIEVGLWEEHGETWTVPSYLKRNPSKKEIETKAELAKESGEYGAHERWHVQEGRKSPKCRFCIAERMGTPIDPPNRVGYPTTEPVPEPQPEPEPEPIASTGSSFSKVTPPTETTKRSKIVDTIVDIRANGQAKGPKWRETVAQDVEARHGAKIDQWLEKFPDAPVDALASALESGDSRGLAYFTYHHSPPPEPERRLSAEERAALMAEAGAPEKFTQPRTEEA